MKKTFLALSMVSSLLFGYEVSLNQTFSEKVIPNEISFYINVTTKAKTSKEVISKLKKIDSYFNSHKEVEIRGGRYNSYPNYIYKNKKRTFDGYKGNISFIVTSKKKKAIEFFISKVTKQNFGKNTTLSVSSRDWKIDDKTKEETFDKLRFKAILWAKQYAKEVLSDKVDDKCKVSKINLTSTRPYTPYLKNSAKNMSNNNVPLPKQTPKEISISANYTFTCK